MELDMHVLGVIRPCLSRNIVANVVKETTTKGVDEGFMRSLGANEGATVSNSVGTNKVELKVVVERILSEETGHMKRHYKANDDAHVVLNDYSDALILSVNSSIDSWIVDCGASFHTMHDRDVMVNYVSGNYGTVHLADGDSWIW
ncbi:hypothetical protein LIER_26674 [Lithospermum erythrorhizon]|uniref:Uncharacterized protein n=1 Tax=Lithospermum erythrorhizon TaxID=34254 RepID=A0AAV3R984_LITER